MAHEVDEASSRKRIIRWENGQPVYASPSTESDDEEAPPEDASDTDTPSHDEKDPDD